MKRLIALVLILGMFSCVSCFKKKTFTLKGRLLKSCDNPVPVEDYYLYMVSENKRYGSHSARTSIEGNFIIQYDEGHNLGSEAFIFSSQNGPLLEGIPTRQDLDLGDIYLTDRYFALVQIFVQRSTSVEDTIYYEYLSWLGYNKSIVGPFQDEQIIDSVQLYGIPVYDTIKFNKKPQGGYMFKTRYNNKDTSTKGIGNFEVCRRDNVFDIILR